jgi:hypothetical protein
MGNSLLMGMFDHLPSSREDAGGRMFGHLPKAAPLAQPKTFERNEDEALYRQYLDEETKRYAGPRVPLSGVEEPKTAEEAAILRVQEQRSKEQEQAAFDASRTPLKRASDASVFALSAPIRALTRGEYGFGDVVGAAIPSSGDYYKQAEREFVRANRSWLEPVAAAGEISMGIPALQSMGAVPGQMLRTSAAATNKALAPIANRLLPAAPRATPAQAYGPAQRIIDRQAFIDEGIPEFAPAFTSKGTARAARTVEELPIVGGTVKTPKLATEQAMAARQKTIAQGIGAAASPEDVGLIAQRGLDRFRTADLEDLDRSTVQSFGISPNKPPAKVSGTVNVNKPGQLNTAAMSAQELDQAAQSRVTLPGSTRTAIDDLSPAAIERIVRRPARDTSFQTKSAALYRQAEDSRPSLMRANDTKNSDLLATRNSALVARGLMQQEQSAAISGGVLEGRFGRLVTDLANGRRNFTLDSLRAARTEVGRALSNFGQYDARLDRTQLKQLYGAISDDYQSGLVALAARARKASRLSPRDKNYIAPSIADAADKALQKYRLADRYYRQGIERMDRFMQVLGADTLEQASRRIGQYLRENTQNVRAVESIVSSLRPEEAKAILGNVIENLGKLTPGAREAERVFSFERYATDWNKINQSQRVRGLFVKALGPEVVQSLDNLGRIAERMKFYETTKNYSGSAYTGALSAGAAVFLNPKLWPALIATVAGTAAMGKVLTSKSFATWVNSLNRAQVKMGGSMSSTGATARQHLRRLTALARQEPDPEIAAALTALAYQIGQQVDASGEGGEPSNR